MFLIQDASSEGGMLALDNVFVLDAASRSVAREEVVRETDSEDPMDNVLRIRCRLSLARLLPRQRQMGCGPFNQTSTTASVISLWKCLLFSSSMLDLNCGTSIRCKGFQGCHPKDSALFQAPLPPIRWPSRMPCCASGAH